MENEKLYNSQKKSMNFIKIGQVVFIMLCFIIICGMWIFVTTMSSIPDIMNDIYPAESSQIFDINGKQITTIHSVENRLPVPINKIPQNLQKAFLAAEDVRFYHHIGIDIRGIFRAIWINMGNDKSEGASTITQQLVRNVLLNQEQSFKRKLHEALVSLQIERKYSKEEIFEMYMNQIYFGHGAYGVQSASQVYFGKNIEDLDLAECTLLAGIPQSPNYYNPLTNLKAAKERQNTILDQMIKYGYIDKSTADFARHKDIKINSNNNKSNCIASYFVSYVIQQLIEKYGDNAVYKEGLKIYTTIDLNMQAVAEKLFEQLQATKIDINGIKQPQGALVAIDHHNGYIKAMIGGRGDDQFNRAILAQRQPGSVFKPFVYLAAIEAGMSPNTILDDSPISLGSYSPENYDHIFRGPVTLREALEKSLNVPTVKLVQQVSPEKVLHYAELMGIKTLVLSGPKSDANLSSFLGGLTYGVTPMQITSAYGVLANGGVRVEPVAIIKVIDRNGKILEQNTLNEKTVISERSAYILVDIMKGVINKGTGKGANIGRPAAGKTGTTSDYKDAWFVGFTPDITTSVWIGHDSEDVLDGMTGAGLPAKIWKSFMEEILMKYPSRDFAISDSFVVEQPSETIKKNNENINNSSNKESNEENSLKNNSTEKNINYKNNKSNNKNDVIPKLPQSLLPPKSRPKES